MEVTSRQQYILSLLTRHYDSLSRTEIAAQLNPPYAVSRATLIRDLRVLEENGLIESIGSGPGTRYRATSITRILRPIDTKAYFSVNQDDRYLVGTGNDTFFEDLASTDLLSLSEKARIDRVNDEYRMRVSSKDSDAYRRELQRFTVDLAWKSSRIEGNTYSLLETEQLLRTLQGAANRSTLETQMIINHKTALDHILGDLERFHSLTVEDILAVHAILAHELGISTGVRTQPVGIIGTNYRPVDNERELLENLVCAVEVATSKSHPVEAAMILSGLIAYLQPFIDGNKRTARLAANALLLAHGYAALSYRNVDEIEYKKAVLLIDEQQTFDPYKEMFLEQFTFAAENYFIS